MNIRKHKIDFADIPMMFEKSMLVQYDNRQDYSEDRWIGIGLLRDIVAVVVFTERDNNTIRIISARKANKNEKKQYYEKIIQNRLGKTGRDE